jgi:Ion channel
MVNQGKGRIGPLRHVVIWIVCLIAPIFVGTVVICYPEPVPPHGEIIAWAAAGVIMALTYGAYFYCLIRFVRELPRDMMGIASFTMISVSFTLLQVISFGICYQNTGLISNLHLGPADYIYFSAMTWTTVGYGDITPSGSSRFLAAVEALHGYIFMGIFIGVFTALMMSVLAEDRDQGIEE